MKEKNQTIYLQGVFFNWSYPKNHKYGKKLKYQKVGNILLTNKHLELFWGDQQRLYPPQII